MMALPGFILRFQAMMFGTRRLSDIFPTPVLKNVIVAPVFVVAYARTKKQEKSLSIENKIINFADFFAEKSGRG